MAIHYWRFGTTSPSRPKGQDSGCFWFLDMGTIGCSETSVRNYHYWLRNSPGERSSHIDDVRKVSSNGSIHLLRHVPRNRPQLRRSIIAGTKCDTLRRTTKPPSYIEHHQPTSLSRKGPIILRAGAVRVNFHNLHGVCVCVCVCVYVGGGDDACHLEFATFEFTDDGEH